MKMTDESTFGKPAEGLQELFSIGADGFIDEDKDSAPSLEALGLMIEKPGSQIDGYKLLRILGEGGMGIVYLAEQLEPIRRKVALKVIKPGMDSNRVITRFEVERQALAMLDHPNIAHVYDAGTTETGRLYFVMEHANGLPITEYCDNYKLTIEDRLRLFVQVCHAVHHAHQKGIIHCDIKPSNILVSMQDDKAVPKIIDFGIAKAVNQPLTERTLITEQGRLIGTPEYMSPEQTDMTKEDIDTRSDVYSLGVLLYVLLTGVLPFESGTLREGGIDNIRQVIRETDPKTPSTRLTKLGEDASAIAQNRRMEIQTLTKHLRRELEWIPLKAMRKDRSERYRSASELADDVDNYLKGAALTAGPPSSVYKLKKFVQRNRALVAGIAAVIAVLIIGVVVSTLFAIKADRQARTSQAISDFFSNDVLAAADPLTGEEPVAYLEPILDIATQRFEGKFENEPLIEASIRYTLARRYWHIGKFDAAESNLNRAVELRRKKVGTGDREVLVYLQELAWVYYYQSKYDEAEKLLTNTIECMQQVLDEADSALQRAKNRLAWLYLGQYERHEEAEKIWAELIEVVQRRLGPEHPDSVGHMQGLAKAYMAQGRLEEAENVIKNAVDLSQRTFGIEHNTTLNTIRSYADICKVLGNHKKAEDLYVKVIQSRRRVLGEEHFSTLGTMHKLASLYIELERHDEAEQLLIPALETNRRVYGEENPGTLNIMHTLGILRRKQKLYEQVEELLTEVLDSRRTKLGHEHPRTLESLHELGVLYLQQARNDEAERLLIEVFECRRLKLGDKHPHTIESINCLIALYEAWNKPEKAEKWWSKLPKSESVTE
jgi:serine/threonine protein kinase/tetratricopeptide (TPR) repeat protein